MWMVWQGAFVSKFSCGFSLLSGARYSLFIYLFIYSWLQTLSSLFTLLFYAVTWELPACSLCVYVKTLLGFWWGRSAANVLVLFALCKQHLRADWKLRIVITCLLSLQKSACLSLFFSPPTAAFTLKTIEVIRSNITSLERCHRGADFKCVWVIVPI